jgi:hypothetical protein
MKNSKIVSIVLAGLALCLNSSVASAKQTIRIIDGREVVVHTNPIPVVLHRLVPPQRGRHVTQREVDQGKFGRVTSGPVSNTTSATTTTKPK